MSETDKKHIIFFKTEKFSSECSSGLVESSFENSTEYFQTQGRKFFAQCPKMLKKNVFIKKFPQKFPCLLLISVVIIIRKQFNFLLCERGPLSIFIYPPKTLRKCEKG